MMREQAARKDAGRQGRDEAAQKMPRGQMPPPLLLLLLLPLLMLLLLLLLLLRRRCPTAVGSRRPFSPEGRKHAPARSTHAARQKAAAWLHHPKLSAGHKGP